MAQKRAALIIVLFTKGGGEGRLFISTLQNLMTCASTDNCLVFKQSGALISAWNSLQVIQLFVQLLHAVSLLTYWGDNVFCMHSGNWAQHYLYT